MAPLGGVRTPVAKKNAPPPHPGIPAIIHTPIPLAILVATHHPPTPTPFPPAQCWECEKDEAATHAPFNLGQGGGGEKVVGGAILFGDGCMVLAKIRFLIIFWSFFSCFLKRAISGRSVLNMGRAHTL